MASKTSPASRLRLRPATPADVPELVRIHFSAFGPGVMNRLMHPDGGSASARANFGKSFFPEPKGGAAGPKPSPVEDIIMVAELVPDAGAGAGAGDRGAQPEIVAFAKWKLVKEPLPEEEACAEEAPMTAEQFGEGSNAEVYNVFIGGMHRLRQKWMKGDPGLRECLPPVPPFPLGMNR